MATELQTRTDEWNRVIMGRNQILAHLQKCPAGQRRLTLDEIATLARVIRACNARLIQIDPRVAEYYGITGA